jgi:uncharacterized protein (DUF4415 family)
MKKPTKKQMEELNNLALLPDESIDTSDIPEQVNWENAVVGKFYSKKQKTSVEIDNDILAWFKSQNVNDYQQMINKALSDYVRRHN